MELKMSLWMVGPQSPCDMHTAPKPPWVMKIWAECHVRGQQLYWRLSCTWEWTTLAAIITWPVCCMNIIQLYSFKKHHTRMEASSTFIMDLQHLFSSSSFTLAIQSQHYFLLWVKQDGFISNLHPAIASDDIVYWERPKYWYYIDPISHLQNVYVNAVYCISVCVLITF